MTKAEFEFLQNEILSKGKQVSNTKWEYDKYTLTLSDSKMAKIKVDGKTFVFGLNDFDIF